MRKELKEIIENLKDVEASMRARGGLVNLENSNRMVQQIGRLSALTKPVQYVVEVRKDAEYNAPSNRVAMIGRHYLCYGSDISKIKADSLIALNEHTDALGLPLITIYQITFIEPEA